MKHSKKILAAALAGMLLLPFSGCTNENAAPGQAPAATKVEVPARPARDSQPIGTLKFGNLEARIYEFTGPEEKIMLGTNRQFAATEEALYFTRKGKSAGEDDYVLLRQNYKGEKLEGDPVSIDHVGKGNTWFRTSGNTLFYHHKGGPDEFIAWYDGKEAHQGDVFSGKDVIRKNLALSMTGNDAYFQRRTFDKETKKYIDGVYHANLENGKFTNEKMLFEYSVDPIFEEGKASLMVRFADKDHIILSVDKKKEGEGSAIVNFYEVDKNGKILATYDDGDHLHFQCATLTANYFIRCNTHEDGQVLRVFDRATGQLLGEALISKKSETAPQIMPKCMWTTTGNDVIVYDESAKKLYRIDF